jgi:hypothetical protein
MFNLYNQILTFYFTLELASFLLLGIFVPTMLSYS